MGGEGASGMISLMESLALNTKKNFDQNGIIGVFAKHFEQQNLRIVQLESKIREIQSFLDITPGLHERAAQARQRNDGSVREVNGILYDRMTGQAIGPAPSSRFYYDPSTGQQSEVKAGLVKENEVPGQKKEESHPAQSSSFVLKI